MTIEYNIYLDESCHLPNDESNVMVLGCIWCPLDKTHEISERLRDIKYEHNLANRNDYRKNRGFELKWQKISPSQANYYYHVIDYFFDDDDLHFRGVIIPDKRILRHEDYLQDHDTWYYKMCFTLLEPIIDPTAKYNIYLDIKDTRSETKRRKLEEVLRNKRRDPHGKVIKKIQQIRSHESELLQLADLLIGAVNYSNRKLSSSASKLEIVERIYQRSGLSLKTTTWLREPKINLLCWRGSEDANA